MQPNFAPNTVNQTVDYGGMTWKGNPGQGWTAMHPTGQGPQDQQKQIQDAQAAFQAQQGSAVNTLQTQKNSLADQYSSLLSTVKGEYDPLINQTTATAGAELSRRGLTPDSTLFQQQTQGALQPVYGAEAANAQQIGAGSVSDMNSLAAQIAQLQSGGAQFSSQLPLQYGSLQLQQTQQPFQNALLSAQTQEAQTAANFIPIPGLGLYNTKTGQISPNSLGGNGGAGPSLNYTGGKIIP